MESKVFIEHYVRQPGESVCLYKAELLFYKTSSENCNTWQGLSV